jgi:non-ribosomal peptide synthetase component F
VLGSVPALAGFARWSGPEFGLGPGDRVAFTAGVSFEAGLRDLFPPLVAGAAVVVPGPADLADPAGARAGWPGTGSRC